MRKIISVLLSACMVLTMAAPVMAEDGVISEPEEVVSESEEIVSEDSMPVWDGDIQESGADSDIAIVEEDTTNSQDETASDVSDGYDTIEINQMNELSAGNIVKGDNWIYDTKKNILTVYKVGNKTTARCPYDYESKVKKVIIKKGITGIESGGFSGCSNLSSVSIAEGVRDIDSYAFSSCHKLKKIKLPNSLKRIGDSAFDSCSALTEVIIPKGVTTIEYNGFAYCDNLANVDIPATVKTFGAHIFNCSEMVNVECYKGSKAEKYVKKNDVSYTCKGVKSYKGYSGDDADWKLDVKSGKLTITGKGQMYDYSDVNASWYSHRNAIKSVVIKSGITNIGSSTFSGCANLKSVSIPESVESIGSSAFFCCRKLTNIKLPSKLEYIGEHLFDGCNSLTKIVLPSGITSIGYCAFSGCNSLKEINIPDGVKYINSSAFSGDVSLTKVNLPDSLTSIYSYAFAGCEKLKNITIPRNVEDISERAFSNCKNLTKVTIKAVDPILGIKVFNGCKKLTIYGYDGGRVKSYVRKYAIPFKAIGKLSSVTFAVDSNMGYILKENGEQYETSTIKYVSKESFGKLPKVYIYPNEDGFIFDGWTDGATGLDIDENSIVASSDMSLKAKYRKLKYTIKFDPNGGTGTKDDIGALGSHGYYLDADFERPGYEIESWNTKPDGSGESFEYRQTAVNLTLEDGGVVTLYAQWKAK